MGGSGGVRLDTGVGKPINLSATDPRVLSGSWLSVRGRQLCVAEDTLVVINKDLTAIWINYGEEEGYSQ